MLEKECLDNLITRSCSMSESWSLQKSEGNLFVCALTARYYDFKRLLFFHPITDIFNLLNRLHPVNGFCCYYISCIHRSIISSRHSTFNNFPVRFVNRNWAKILIFFDIKSYFGIGNRSSRRFIAYNWIVVWIQPQSLDLKLFLLSLISKSKLWLILKIYFQFTKLPAKQMSLSNHKRAVCGQISDIQITYTHPNPTPTTPTLIFSFSFNFTWSHTNVRYLEKIMSSWQIES